MKHTLFNNRPNTPGRMLGAVVAVAALLLSATSCKTSEQNYQRAYETARQKQIDEAGGATVYNAIRRQATTSRTVVDGDSVAVRKEVVSIPPKSSTPASALKRYNVVAGQFKQLFHARSLTSRLAEAGYEGSFIVQTREPLYYVVAAASDSIEGIMPAYRTLRDNPPFRLIDPCPWVLRPANR